MTTGAIHCAAVQFLQKSEDLFRTFKTLEEIQKQTKSIANSLCQGGYRNYRPTQVIHLIPELSKPNFHATILKEAIRANLAEAKVLYEQAQYTNNRSIPESDFKTRVQEIEDNL